MSLTSDTMMTMPVVPAGASGYGGGNGMFGDNGAWWIIILFLFVFCGWGNGNWGGNSGMNGGVGSEVQRGFDHSSVVTKLDGITHGICDSTYAVTNAVKDGFSNAELSRCNQQASLMQQLFAMQSANQQCCCETQRLMERGFCDTNYNNQNNTRDIITNQNDNTRAILDFLVQDKLATKDARIASLETQLSQVNQNSIIGARIDAATAEILRRSGHDCPTAAYIVQPPTPVNFPTNCCGTFTGYNNGCGGCG